MSNPSGRRPTGGKQVPLDHLRPGGRHPEAPTGEPTGAVGGSGPEPAEPGTPGAGEGDALRGKATGSPANVGTRPHLEGSEQGPA